MSNKRDVIFLDHLHRLVIANDGNETQTTMMRKKEEKEKNRENDNKMKQWAEDGERKKSSKTDRLSMVDACLAVLTHYAPLVALLTINF